MLIKFWSQTQFCVRSYKGPKSHTHPARRPYPRSTTHEARLSHQPDQPVHQTLLVPPWCQPVDTPCQCSPRCCCCSCSTQQQPVGCCINQLPTASVVQQAPHVAPPSPAAATRMAWATASLVCFVAGASQTQTRRPCVCQCPRTAESLARAAAPAMPRQPLLTPRPPPLSPPAPAAATASTPPRLTPAAGQHPLSPHQLTAS